MKAWMTLLFAAGLTMAASGPAAGQVLAPLISYDPFGPDGYRLDLFDPSQPRSSSNPDAVELNLRTNAIFSARLIRSARVADGLVQPLDFPLLAYISGEALFRRDLRPDASHDRVRVSGLGKICSMNGQVIDLAHPVASWVRIRRKGSDGTCFGEVDDYRLVRLSMGPDEMGVRVTENQFYAPLLDASGAITSFITATVDDPVTPKLERRNNLFREPVTIANLDPLDPFVRGRQFDFATTFVVAHVAGAPSRGLYRIEESKGGPVLSPLLHRFEPGEGLLTYAASDGQYLYFGHGNRLFRIPLDATSPTQASRLFRAPQENRYITNIALSSPDNPRIFFESHELATDRHTWYSMAKDGSSEAVVLASRNPFGSASADLVAISGSRVYFKRNGELHAVQDDGSGFEHVPGWPVLVVPARADPDLASEIVVIADKILVEGPAPTAGYSEYRMLDAETATFGCRMGRLRQSFGVFSPELVVRGRTLGLWVQRPEESYPDVYVLDLKTCGSLQPASRRSEVEEVPVWGY